MVPLPEDKASRLVVLGDFVTAEDGSGLVHMAPAFGADDFQAGIEHNLALVRPVAADGTLLGTTWPEIEGRLVTARETNDLIIQRLKQDGRWHLTASYSHTYPHCWRCSSPLIYYARDSWFVRTSAVKGRMLELQPPGRLASARGRRRAIRRVAREQRGLGAVAGSLLGDATAGLGLRSRSDPRGRHRQLCQLAEHWGRPLPEGFDPHKPFINTYTWRCACGGLKHRAPEVIDTWFDSLNIWKTAAGQELRAKRSSSLCAASPATDASFSPMLRTVSIIPGIENFVPERTETSSGAEGITQPGAPSPPPGRRGGRRPRRWRPSGSSAGARG